MQKFEGISFLWAIALLLLIGLFYGVRAFMGFRNVAKEAVEDYTYKKERGMLDPQLSEQGYIRVYKQLHNPRRPAYIAAAIFMILVFTWPIMAVLSVLLEQFYQLTGRNRVFEPGFLVWQFSIFFGMIFSWTGIAYFMARRYHMRAPGTLAYETEQQILEEQTGSREKVVYDNDWGLPPFMVIGGVFLGFAAIIYRIFFR